MTPQKQTEGPSDVKRRSKPRSKDETRAAALRAAVLEGYDDIRQDRTRPYTGDLRAMLESYRAERGSSDTGSCGSIE